MAERLHDRNGELSPENQEALNREREKRNEELERLRDNAAERAGEKSKDLSELERTAEKAAEREKKTAEKETAPVEKRRDTPRERKAKAAASYMHTMDDAQAHMKPAERTFSKLIHNKTVEKTSEVVGDTVARPNAILAGSLTAFLFTLVIYLVARYYGYPLSGAETIAAFILGWAVGLLFDYLRVMITGKKA